MELLNGLSYLRKTRLEWHKIHAIIEGAIDCDYISVREVERMEDCIDVYFDILDKSKSKEIKEVFYKFCDNVKIEEMDIFDDVDEVCNAGDEYYEIRVDKPIYLNIIESYLREAYNVKIKVVDIEACYEYVGVLFESENYISNELTENQKDTLKRVLQMKDNKALNMLKELKDNEVIINVPIKLNFSPYNDGILGMINELDLSYIFECNKKE